MTQTLTHLTTRRATSGDAPVVVALFLEAMELLGEKSLPSVADEYWRTALGNPDVEVWLLESGTVAVGFADMVKVVVPTMPYSRVLCQYMYVQADVNASALMRRVRRFALARDADTVELVCAVNAPQTEYWTRHGFVPTLAVLRGKPQWEDKLEERHG